MTEIQSLIKKYNIQHKKIAFFVIYDTIPVNSGGDWYSYQILSDLSENNEVVEYYTKKSNGKEGYFPSNVNFKRIFLENGKKFNKFWSKVSPKIEMIKPDLLFKNSHLSYIDADIIFTIVECYHIARYISKINNNAPIVLVMQNIEWKYLKNIDSYLYLPMKYYENYVLTKVDAVISISAKGAEYASNYTNNNIFHVPPKIHHLFTPEGEKYEYGNDKLNLLFYGSLDREQNIYALNFIKKELIPLMKKERIMDKVRVNIFGSGNPPKALDLENDNDINFLGTVEDPSKYIRGSDIVIVPLKNSAGIKIRIIESLGCHKHVIATSEAVENLSSKIKKDIYIKNNAEGFLDIIKAFIIT
jgi:hypothetical protein